MRYNILYATFKALRAMLYEAGLEIQRIDFTNDIKTRESLRNLTFVVDFFDRHINDQEEFVFARLEPFEPSVLDKFRQEHRKIRELTTGLRTLIAIYGSLTTEAERIQLGSALRRSFNEFLAFTVIHLVAEEETVNALLWRYYTDEALEDVEVSIESNKMSASRQNGWKWMLRGLNNPEIVYLLRAVENNYREIDFNNIISLAEKELSNLRFRQVLEGLTEGQMTA